MILLRDQTVGGIKACITRDHGHEAHCIDIMNITGVSEDPMPDDGVIDDGMQLFASFRPPVSGEIQMSKNARFSGILTTMAGANGYKFPKQGTITVTRSKTITRIYHVSAFGHQRGQVQGNPDFRLDFFPSMIDEITWLDEHKTETTFRPSNPADKNMLTSDVRFGVNVDGDGGTPHDWTPHRPGFRDPTRDYDVLSPGILTMSANTEDKKAFETSSEWGFCLFDGKIVAKYASGVTPEIHRTTRELTWKVTAHNLVISKFACIRQAAMMHDMITYYTNPDTSSEFYIDRPVPQTFLKTASWQDILKLDNVMNRLHITKTPTTAIGRVCLEFALRMYITLAVNTLITQSDDPSPTSTHGPMFSRVQSLICHVPPVGKLRTGRMTDLVKQWALFYTSYHDSVDMRGNPCLVRIVRPEEFYRNSNALGSVLVITSDEGQEHTSVLGRAAFMTTRHIHDGHMPVFQNDKYTSFHPAAHRIYAFASAHVEEPATKKRCLAAS